VRGTRRAEADHSGNLLVPVERKEFNPAAFA
jgi:hypothetical protein